MKRIIPLIVMLAVFVSSVAVPLTITVNPAPRATTSTTVSTNEAPTSVTISVSSAAAKDVTGDPCEAPWYVFWAHLQCLLQRMADDWIYGGDGDGLSG